MLAAFSKPIVPFPPSAMTVSGATVQSLTFSANATSCLMLLDGAPGTTAAVQLTTGNFKDVAMNPGGRKVWGRGRCGIMLERGGQGRQYNAAFVPICISKHHTLAPLASKVPLTMMTVLSPHSSLFPEGSSSSKVLVPVPAPGLTSAAFGLNIATAASLGLSAISCMLSVAIAPGWDSLACAAGLLRSLSHLQIVSWTSHMAADMPAAVDIAASSASWASLAVLPIAWTNWSASMSNALPYIAQQAVPAPPPPVAVSNYLLTLTLLVFYRFSFLMPLLPPPFLPLPLLPSLRPPQ